MRQLPGETIAPMAFNSRLEWPCRFAIDPLGHVIIAELNTNPATTRGLTRFSICCSRTRQTSGLNSGESSYIATSFCKVL